jgi:indole-3-glycerol phosphate synthase
MVTSLLAVTFLGFSVCAPLARAEEKVKKSELSNTMSDIDDAMKKLRRDLRKPEKNEESLQLIAEIEKNMLACKSMTPTKAQKIPEADRAKFVTAYRKEMAGVISTFCQMEQALLDGDNAKAQALYKTITTTEDKDHDRFMEKEKK